MTSLTPGTSNDVEAVESMADLITNHFPPIVESVHVKTFYKDGSGGGGVLYWDSSRSQIDHNGGTVIDPDHSITPGNSGWWSSENTGSGCFVRPKETIVSVKQFGAKGDGSADDTAAINGALGSGANTIVFDGTDNSYQVDTLTIGSAVRTMRGEGLPLVQQRSDKTHLIDASALTDVDISGIKFKGFSGGTLSSDSQMIVLDSCTRFIIHLCVFTNSNQRPIQAFSCDKLYVRQNSFKNCAAGPTYEGCIRSNFIDNTIDGSSQADSDFKVAFQLAPHSSTHGVNVDITISDNRIRDIQDGQGILLHSGKRVAITGNIVQEAAQGVSINPFDSNDSFEDISVTGNVFVGIGSGAGYTPTSEQAIAVHGTDVVSKNIVVSGNSMRDFNNTLNAKNKGAMSVIGIESLTITGNIISESDRSAIAFSGQNTSDVVISGNTIKGITSSTAAADDAAIKVDKQAGTIIDGYIGGNFISNCFKAFLIEGSLGDFSDLIIDDEMDANNNNPSTGSSRARYNRKWVSVDDTTPSVKYNTSVIQFDNSGATTVTDLDDGIEGQVVTLFDTGGNTTLSEDSDGGGNFKLSANSDFSFSASDIIQVIYDGTKWQEVSRSSN